MRGFNHLHGRQSVRRRIIDDGTVRYVDGPPTAENPDNWTLQGSDFNEASLGVSLKHRLSPTLDLAFNLRASHRFGFEDIPAFRGMPEVTPMRIGPSGFDTRNILSASIGIHKNFNVGVQTPQIQRRQRQARQPRRTTITCPHMQPRPWETVQPFNHPIAR